MRAIATLTAATLCCVVGNHALLAQGRQPTGKQEPLPSEVLKRQLAQVDKQASRSAHGFRHAEIPGERVAENVAKLTSRLRWHGSLGSALRSGRQQDKPIVWIQALGDLTGYL